MESKDKVPSLLDADGYLWPDNDPAKKNIKAEDAEREIRAQIEKAMAMGIHPTHVDSHMGVSSPGPTCFAAYVKVADEYKLPFLAAFDTADAPAALSHQLRPTRTSCSTRSSWPAPCDSLLPTGRTSILSHQESEARKGLTEFIVHLGARRRGDCRPVTIDHPDYGSAWRQRDYDVITSPEFKKALRGESRNPHPLEPTSEEAASAVTQAPRTAYESPSGHFPRYFRK